MMKYAIIADIHANLEALEVVWDDIKAQACTHVACLGDVVGYNANPKECLEIIRGMNIPCVKGNHDEYCSSEEGLEGFNPHAEEAIQWTRAAMSSEPGLAAARSTCRIVKRACTTSTGRSIPRLATRRADLRGCEFFTASDRSRSESLLDAGAERGRPTCASPLLEAVAQLDQASFAPRGAEKHDANR